MSYAKVFCASLVGVGGRTVEVEAYLAQGIPAFVLTGLPDTALNEARDRVRAAIANSGESWPQRRITINLRPASVPKSGSAFDLAIAVAVLGGTGELPLAAVEQVLILGELGLDGSVRPVRGVLPMVAAAARQGVTETIVPMDNAAEATLVPGMRVHAAESLAEVLAFIRGEQELPPPIPSAARSPGYRGLDLADVAGQEKGRLAVEVAAAGGHHLALFGSPGAGKTMLAQRLPTILPDLDDAAALEVTSLYSVAGLLAPGAPLIRQPPFHAPHHSSSIPALIGGGSGVPRPGALSLAHRGVLFMDEAPEWGTRILDSLRQPLEDGLVRIGRAEAVVEFPARIMLVLAANPCPCARPDGDIRCECTPSMKKRYIGRLSGPLLDRIDLQVTLPPVKAAHLLDGVLIRESSQVVAERVAAARAVALSRWANLQCRTNAEVPGNILHRKPWRLPDIASKELRHRLDKGLISARGYDRIIRVAWTVADLRGGSAPTSGDLNVALELREKAKP